MAGLTLKSIFEAVDRVTGPVRTMSGNVSKSMGALGAGFHPVNKAVSALGKTIAAVLPAVSLAAVGKAITSFTSKGDEIAKTARMLGLTTDALQELRYAAGLQGVEDAQLTQGIKLLNNQLGQLQTGEGSLYSTLKRSDPALAKRLRTVKDTDAAFMVLMDAISSETNIQKRATIAQAAFGKSGQELIKYANGGRDAIAGLRSEAHKYGLVIDEEATYKSEAFDDSMSRLKQTLGALANNGLGQIVAKLQPVMQGWADWLAANREMISLKIDSAFTAIGDALRVVKGAWDSGLIPAIIAGVTAFEAVTKAIAAYNTVTAIMASLAMTNPLGWIAAAVAGVVGLITLIIANWDKITGFFDRLRGGSSAGDTVAAAAGQAETDAWGVPVAGPMSSQAAMASTFSSSVSRSEVAVTFGNAPAGTAIKQTGKAPGVTLALGAMAGGYR